MTGVPLADVVVHIDRALRGMVDTLTDLGDEAANARPAVSGANTAYQIVTHCLGVMEFWGGQVLAGRIVERDRAAEFRAEGPVGQLLDRIDAQRTQLAADLGDFDGSAPPPGPIPGRDQEDMPEFTRTQGGVLLHLYEELARHRGHLDITADLVREKGRRGPGGPLRAS